MVIGNVLKGGKGQTGVGGFGWYAWGGANLGGILGVGGLGWVKLGVGCLGRGGLMMDSIDHFLLWELLTGPLSVKLENFESMKAVL
jgi:hypothetical protein